MTALIVDDERTSQTLLRRVLMQMGHDVQMAETREEAMNYLEGSIPVDVVFLEWHLSDVNGSQLTCDIRAKMRSKAQPFIIMMTQSLDPSLIQLAFDAGADDFLPKPLTVAQIWARIRSAERVSNLNQSVFQGQHQAIRHLMCEVAKDWFKRALHEVTTPLSVITFSSEILSSELPEADPMQAYCEKISRNSDLVRSILQEQWNHFDQGATEKRLLNLGELVHEGIKQIHILAMTSKVHINYDPPAFTPTICGNFIELMQLLFNLVTNALDAASSSLGQEVHLRISEEDESFKIHIRNKGLPNPNLSGELIRSAGRAQSNKGGHHQSLGLRICRRIAEEHGGELSAETGADYNEVIISLPKAPAETR